MTPSRRACVDCGHGFDAIRKHSIRCAECKYQRQRLVSRIAQVVAKAIADGRLAPITGQPCVDCSAPASVYDHRDYRKPLKVEPVCIRCNLSRGAARHRST